MCSATSNAHSPDAFWPRKGRAVTVIASGKRLQRSADEVGILWPLTRPARSREGLARGLRRNLAFFFSR